jgi:hypothetical protein
MKSQNIIRGGIQASSYLSLLADIVVGDNGIVLLDDDFLGRL